MTPIRPEDLAGASWREYVRDLRATWPKRTDRFDDYGTPSRNPGFSAT